MWRRVAAGLVGVLTMATPALAGGPSFDWAGPHVGMNGGGAWGNPNWNVDFLGTNITTGSFGVSGGMVGATAGYDLQNGPLVLGGVGAIHPSGGSGHARRP